VTLRQRRLQNIEYIRYHSMWPLLEHAHRFNQNGARCHCSIGNMYDFYGPAYSNNQASSDVALRVQCEVFLMMT
jgi:hypothetical protein